MHFSGTAAGAIHKAKFNASRSFCNEVSLWSAGSDTAKSATSMGMQLLRLQNGPPCRLNCAMGCEFPLRALWAQKRGHIRRRPGRTSIVEPPPRAWSKASVKRTLPPVNQTNISQIFDSSCLFVCFRYPSCKSGPGRQDDLLALQLPEHLAGLAVSLVLRPRSKLNFPLCVIGYNPIPTEPRTIHTVGMAGSA